MRRDGRAITVAAYLVGTIRVSDPARWEQYVGRVGATFAPFGGRVLFRGTPAAALTGRAHGDRIVVVEFADVAAARRWHESAEYQTLVALREAAADVVLTIYEA
jgi:uncharacterized protein (DUF1330 family)